MSGNKIINLPTNFVSTAINMATMRNSEIVNANVTLAATFSVLVEIMHSSGSVNVINLQFLIAWIYPVFWRIQRKIDIILTRTACYSAWSETAWQDGLSYYCSPRFLSWCFSRCWPINCLYLLTVKNYSQHWCYRYMIDNESWWSVLRGKDIEGWRSQPVLACPLFIRTELYFNFCVYSCFNLLSFSTIPDSQYERRRGCSLPNISVFRFHTMECVCLYHFTPHN